jgi:beta-mannanase
MATTIKGFGARVNFIFEHEPDARSSLPSGNGAQFVAAWRNIWNVFHARGLTSANVRFVATYTGVIFTRASPRNIKDYYPGDAYVDAVAIDPYNWSWCRGEHWKELGYLIESQRLWGLAHPSKQLMIMEFGSPEDKSSAGHKAQWIRNAEALFKLPAYHQYTAVLYFTGRVVSGGCPWDFKSSSSSLAAFRSMTNDPAYLGRG